MKQILILVGLNLIKYVGTLNFSNKLLLKTFYNITLSFCIVKVIFRYKYNTTYFKSYFLSSLLSLVRNRKYNSYFHQDWTTLQSFQKLWKYYEPVKEIWAEITYLSSYVVLFDLMNEPYLADRDILSGFVVTSKRIAIESVFYNSAHEKQRFLCKSS